MSEAKLNDKLIATQSGYVTVYNYDELSQEYLSSSHEFLMAGVGIPANSVVDVPLENKIGYAICRSIENGRWEYISDHRGKTLYKCGTGEPVLINNLGDYPDDLTTLKPATPYDRWNGTTWVTDTEAMKNQQIVEAERKKSELLADAKNMISEWQTELQLGLIDEADKASLISWLAYIKDVKAVETNDAPDLEWPTPPVEPAK